MDPANPPHLRLNAPALHALGLCLHQLTNPTRPHTSSPGRLQRQGHHAGHRRKGRYAPLEVIVQRRGAAWLLELDGNLIGGAVGAMVESAICGPVSAFLTTLLRQLWRELQATGLCLVVIQPFVTLLSLAPHTALWLFVSVRRS